MEQRTTSHSDSEQKVYKIGKKEYQLAEELVKGGCQGCAFYNKIDCATTKINKTQTRSDICNSEHKIFMRLINHK